MKPAVLVTADGQEFVGESVGADGVATGEAVFNTSMTGYQEILSDPSYAGQVVVMTASHIGNYGVANADEQAEAPYASAFVMRSMARLHSNWRAEGGLGEYLGRHGIVGIGSIDTRRLTRHLRDRGAMPVAVGVDCDRAELVELAAQAPRMEGCDLASGVSTLEPYMVSPTETPIGRVVA
ncbi:MAG: carbamoyl phosphate synthase small subunit, partial [Acidimicrobiia bacterium]|nr:carbamoyl phosphate synthase small subunit [Acidimicrobiia bacterium]